MMRPTIGLHPAFDELSAFADRADTEVTRSRVGRHVARCATCRDAVAEIRALGEAVRASEMPGAPAGLWARIERSLDNDVASGPGRSAGAERSVAIAATRDAEPPASDSPKGRGVSTTIRRTSLGIVLVVGALAAVMAMDAREPLAAATPRRLTTDRDFARPGMPITLHYRPIDALAHERSLTVWMLVPGKGEMRFDQALERAGVLRRVSGLDFTGTVALPDSALMVTFVVGDSTGDIIDRTELRNGQMPAVVLAADSAGRPRLDALIAALGGERGSPDRATSSRWAAKMRDLYPSAPETWILSDVHAQRSVIGDIVKLFESRERKYYSWHDRLEHRAGLSAETETMMAALGWELMDTTRAEFWVTRLLHDHPESPSAPALWIDRYRDVPNDSAAVVLRAFEPIYTRPNEANGRALERALMLADRSGDSALVRRWHARIDPRNVSWLLGSELPRLADDSAALADVRRRLMDAITDAEGRMHGGPTLYGRSRFFAWYERQRLRTRLAALQLVAGDAMGAKSALDSIAHDMEMKPSCPTPETMRWRAEASRRLGAMDDARADLAYVATTENWQLQRVGDSVATLLGSAYSKSSWNDALRNARAFHRQCWVDSRDARSRAGG